MALATAAAIRDQVYALIEALTPTSLSGTKFRRLRNEEAANADAWAEKNVTAALRRFQVRQVGGDEMPLVSNTTTERVTLTLEVRVYYPQSQRYGKEAAMDRDDVIREDLLKLNKTVGLYGRGNLTSATDGQYDCTPLGFAEPSRDTLTGVDVLVVRPVYEFMRST